MDYKILTKLLADNVQKITKTVIQKKKPSGMIEGRTMSFHIRFIEDNPVAEIEHLD